jgi:hypothetical protein
VSIVIVVAVAVAVTITHITALQNITIEKSCDMVIQPLSPSLQLCISMYIAHVLQYLNKVVIIYSHCQSRII